MSGFFIRRLTVKGSNLLDATISFNKGANIVTGASDTGKSYIFSAISYVLGANEPPKEINESAGYTDLYLEIGTYRDQKIYTIYRKVGRNQIELKESAMAAFSNTQQGHRKLVTTGTVENPDHISFFLLSLCDLQSKILLFNRNKGITHNLSFDVLRKLTFVDEERIIKTASPFYYSSQFTNQTKGQSLLSLLMTGNDYSDVIEKEDKEAKETRIIGKLEFLSYQISELASEKDTIARTLEASPLSDTNKYVTLDQELESNLKEAREISQKKNELFVKRQEIQDELFYKAELLARFAILERQYINDSERLDFILETSVLTEQLGDTICPICSSPIDSNHIMHISEKEGFKNAATQELEKNKSKLADLRSTIAALSIEEKQVTSLLGETDKELEFLQEQLKHNFSPRIREMRTNLREYLNVEKLTNEISFVDLRIAKLYGEKDRLERLLNEKEKPEEVTILPYTLLSELSTKIEHRLKHWNYEPHVKVDFDSNYKVFDIVISGKNRKSYGKGKRSISYAACLLGVLDYCSEKNRAFSNLIIMDSPLTTFEEKKKTVKDTNEILTTQVLKSFFLDLCNLPSNSQVIIFDNKEPDKSTLEAIKDSVRIQVFTGSTEGRFGFFPITSIA